MDGGWGREEMMAGKAQGGRSFVKSVGALVKVDSLDYRPQFSSFLIAVPSSFLIFGGGGTLMAGRGCYKKR